MAKYGLMIDVTGYCTMVTNVFISAIQEGTSLAKVLVPVSANVSSTIWHLVWWVNLAGSLV